MVNIGHRLLSNKSHHQRLHQRVTVAAQLQTIPLSCTIKYSCLYQCSYISLCFLFQPRIEHTAILRMRDHAHMIY